MYKIHGDAQWLKWRAEPPDTVGWVFWPVKTVGRITYIVLAQTLNHAQQQLAKQIFKVQELTKEQAEFTLGRKLTDRTWQAYTTSQKRKHKDVEDNVYSVKHLFHMDLKKN